MPAISEVRASSMVGDGDTAMASHDGHALTATTRLCLNATLEPDQSQHMVQQNVS